MIVVATKVILPICQSLSLPVIGINNHTADSIKTRRSFGAYIFLLYGGAISWTSKRQQSVAVFSCEAEYMAQTQAPKEAI